MFGHSPTNNRGPDTNMLSFKSIILNIHHFEPLTVYIESRKNNFQNSVSQYLSAWCTNGFVFISIQISMSFFFVQCYQLNILHFPDCIEPQLFAATSQNNRLYPYIFGAGYKKDGILHFKVYMIMILFPYLTKKNNKKKSTMTSVSDGRRHFYFQKISSHLFCNLFKKIQTISYIYYEII